MAKKTDLYRKQQFLELFFDFSLIFLNNTFNKSCFKQQFRHNKGRSFEHHSRLKICCCWPLSSSDSGLPNMEKQHSANLQQTPRNL